VVRRELVLGVLRVAVAMLAVVAMTYQLARLQGHPSFRGADNFFSFFTIQSNIGAATVLVLTALVRPAERSRSFEAVRAAATFYIAITGLVFALLLSGLQEQLDTHNAFANAVVHYVIPIAAVVDWLIDPPRHRLSARIAVAWLAYPLAWFTYTLIRGSVVGWYPYPFVDVSEHGYGRVLVNAVVFLVAFLAGALAFAWLAARRGRLSDGVIRPGLTVRIRSCSSACPTGRSRSSSLGSSRVHASSAWRCARC
jgi:hypothetical protein